MLFSSCKITFSKKIKSSFKLPCYDSIGDFFIFYLLRRLLLQPIKNSLFYFQKFKEEFKNIIFNLIFNNYFRPPFPYHLKNFGKPWVTWCFQGELPFAFFMNLLEAHTDVSKILEGSRPAFTCSKLTIETLKQGVKYGQS